MNDKATAEMARMTKYYRGEYKSLIGRKIIDVRAMYPEEMELFMWDQDAGCVITLDDGGMFIPMMDEEGNGPGQLMVQGKGK